jgi:hypothetical protein
MNQQPITHPSSSRTLMSGPAVDSKSPDNSEHANERQPLLTPSPASLKPPESEDNIADSQAVVRDEERNDHDINVVQVRKRSWWVFVFYGVLGLVGIGLIVVIVMGFVNSDNVEVSHLHAFKASCCGI